MDNFYGINIKYISLLTLVIQNSALVLVMRYSRTASPEKYNTATAVVIAEIIKLIISLGIYIRAESKTRKVDVNVVYDAVFGPNSNWKSMTVPAILYFIQNNLQYVAVTLLDAATFQVTYQFKIITTAMFSVVLLNKRLSTQKWVSLGLLTVGIAIVQFPTDNQSKQNGNQFLGLLAVAVACVLSGMAGVWFEKVLKGSKTSLFLRNVQLSLFSIGPGLIIGVYVLNGQEIAEKGFFHGYTFYTWLAILLQAVGGLIVAMVVKYADNILKGFATSISIILSSICSVFIFNFQLSLLFLVGSIMVLYATHLYSKPDVLPFVEYITVESVSVEKV